MPLTGCFLKITQKHHWEHFHDFTIYHRIRHISENIAARLPKHTAYKEQVWFRRKTEATSYNQQGLWMMLVVPGCALGDWG